MKTIIFVAILTFATLVSCNSENKGTQEEGPVEEAGRKNIVSLSTRQMAAIDLKLGKIEKQNISTSVKSNGRTELLPQNKANVSSLVKGVVKNIFVIEGYFVKRGQTLATLEHPDIVDMQQKYLVTVNNLEYLVQEYRRKKKLFEENVGSGREYQKALSEYNIAKSMAEGLKTKLNMLGISIQALERGDITPVIKITSPIEGYIRFIKVNIGSFVEPDSDMFEIVNNHNIHADLLIYEKDISKIKIGQEVYYNIANLPGRKLKGNIFSVGKAYENEAKAITVHADIKNAGKNLIPGMYVNARIIVDSITTHVVPEDALAAEGNRYYIFIKTKNEPPNEGEEKGRWYFEKTEVIPGSRDNDLVEIKLLKPLPANTEIAINAAYYLLAEMDKGEVEEY